MKIEKEKLLRRGTKNLALQRGQSYLTKGKLGHFVKADSTNKKSFDRRDSQAGTSMRSATMRKGDDVSHYGGSSQGGSGLVRMNSNRSNFGS